MMARPMRIKVSHTKTTQLMPWSALSVEQVSNCAAPQSTRPPRLTVSAAAPARKKTLPRQSAFASGGSHQRNAIDPTCDAIDDRKEPEAIRNMTCLVRGCDESW